MLPYSERFWRAGDWHFFIHESLLLLYFEVLLSKFGTSTAVHARTRHIYFSSWDSSTFPRSHESIVLVKHQSPSLPCRPFSLDRRFDGKQEHHHGLHATPPCQYVL